MNEPKKATSIRLEDWGIETQSKYSGWTFVPFWIPLLLYVGVLLLCYWLDGWRLVALFSISLTIGLYALGIRECHINYTDGLEHGLTQGIRFAQSRSLEELEEEANEIYSASFGKPEWQTQKYFLIAVREAKRQETDRL